MPTDNASHRLDAADIDRAQAISLADIAIARGFVLKRSGRELVGPCPLCGGHDRFAINVAEQLFNCRGCFGKGRGAIAFVRWLDDVGFRDAVEALIGKRSAPVRQSKSDNVTLAHNSTDHDRRQHDKARWLWSQRRPITGSIAETYLREVRGITCPLPPTLGFLPSRGPDRHPAMIASFGICEEPEPGVIIAPPNVQAVHLTLLRPDGSGKADTKPNKIMVGSPSGLPIVIAPMNDLLGLAITEGIEDALSVYQATGLGAWAAGSAPHMPRLVSAIEVLAARCVSIFADADADQQGERDAARLAAALNARGTFAEVLPSAGARS